MSRTLNRPMFRRGGKVDSRGTGITTGLMPRKNFAVGGFSDEDNINISQKSGRAEQIAEEMQNIQDLKNQFGLNYEIPEPEKGLSMSDYINIFGTGADILLTQNPDTVGEKVKETAGGIASNIDKRKIKEQQNIEKAFGVKSGEFDAARTSVLDKEKSESELAAALELQELVNKGKQDSKSYEFGAQLKQLELDYLDDIAAAGDNTDLVKVITDKYKKQRNSIITKEKKNQLKDAFFGNPEIVESLRRQSKDLLQTQVYREYQEDPEKAAKKYGFKTAEEYITSSKFLDAAAEAFIRALQKREESFNQPSDLTEDLKDGGRVGMQMGGMPQEQNTQTPKPGSNSATGLSFDEVRSRLPQEISNDIITLIVNSASALEDFASLQTPQDVENFNDKYNVNLVLPQEA